MSEITELTAEQLAEKVRLSVLHGYVTGLVPDRLKADKEQALVALSELRDRASERDQAELERKNLEQRIEYQRIELARANDRNRRGNEFARKAAEAERDQAVRERDLLRESEAEWQRRGDRAIKAEQRADRLAAALEQIAGLGYPDDLVDANFIARDALAADQEQT